jgi:hypothetical protein
MEASKQARAGILAALICAVVPLAIRGYATTCPPHRLISRLGAQCPRLKDTSNLLPSASFRPGPNGAPLGWSISERSHGSTEVDPNGVLRLKTPQQGTLRLFKEVPLQPEWDGIGATVAMRSLQLEKGPGFYHTAGVGGFYLLPNGRPVRWEGDRKRPEAVFSTFPALFARPPADQQWYLFRTHWPRPQGATRLRIVLAHNNCQGITEIAGLVVEPLSREQRAAFVRQDISWRRR